MSTDKIYVTPCIQNTEETIVKYAVDANLFRLGFTIFPNPRVPIFSIFIFRVMVIFVIKTPQFSMNFHDNLKIKIGKLIFRKKKCRHFVCICRHFVCRHFVCSTFWLFDIISVDIFSVDILSYNRTSPATKDIPGQSWAGMSLLSSLLHDNMNGAWMNGTHEGGFEY